MSRFNPLLAGLACAGLFPATAAQADDRPELRIGVVSSVTGGASAIATGAVAAINLMENARPPTPACRSASASSSTTTVPTRRAPSTRRAS